VFGEIAWFSGLREGERFCDVLLVSILISRKFLYLSTDKLTIFVLILKIDNF